MREAVFLSLVICVSLLSGQASAQVATDVDCTGCVENVDLASNAVTTGKIKDGAVKTPDLATGAVTSGKIRDGAVRTPDIATDAVTTAKIRDGTVAFVDLNSPLQVFLGAAIVNLSTLGASGANSAVASAICPDDRIPISASCSCDAENGSRNLGVLFACLVAGSGAVAGCFDEALTFNPLLPDPLARVTAVCLGAMSADGTPWLPQSTGLAATDTTDSNDPTRDASAEKAQWIAKQQAEFERARSELQNQSSAYRSRVSQGR